MNGCGQSDRPVVPANLPNKAMEVAAEVGEERGTRPVKRVPDSVPELMRPVRWAVCVR
jgi:hypothetical protein